MKERNNKVVNMVESIPVEVSEGQKKLFNIVMENIKSFSTSKSRKKRIGIVAIDLSLLFVDSRSDNLTL